MSTIKNAAPQVILNGINDLSGRPPVIDPEQIPTHLPHVFFFAERGPLEPQLVVGDSRAEIYGANSFDLRGQFATHQTVLANVINERGNQVMAQRLVPEDAYSPATLTLSLDVLSTKVKSYERNADGSYKLDQDGSPIETGEVDGFKAKWIIGSLTDGQSIGQATQGVGSMVDPLDPGNQSVVYPIMELKVAHQGTYGNRLGVRLSAPTMRSVIAADEETIADQNAYLYRIQMVERPESLSTPNVTQTLAGEQYVDFSFKEGVINTRIDKELFIDDVVVPAYQDLEPNGNPPTYSPFSDVHVYHSDLDALLKEVYSKETAYGFLPLDDEDGTAGMQHLINLFTGMDVEGNPYYTYQILGPSEGGAQLTENSTHYAAGGSDGTLDQDTFDLLVRNVCENYDSQPWPLLDTAVYPQSVIYDSGFSLDTKYSLLRPMALRKDMYTVLATQEAGEPQLSASEESSVAIALRAAARSYPESELYGTSTCRALVLAQSGNLISSQWKGILPLTIEFADKCAQFMGAGDGRWEAGFGFDVPGQNHVRMFKNVNNAYKPANVRNRDWDNGLVWAQSYDRRSLFFPAVQTVYNDDTSVLNAAITMMCAVELEKVAERVWRNLTGTSNLTDGQFIERSDRLIEAAVKGRFDDRFVIVPTTTITGNDEQRGFSWTTEIALYAPNMKTVGSVTITARRISDLADA